MRGSSFCECIRVSRQDVYRPETTTSVKTRLGMRQEEERYGSLAASASLFQNLRWLSAMFISATAWTGSPFSKSWPVIPTEASPVVELEFPPMNPVIKMLSLSTLLEREKNSLKNPQSALKYKEGKKKESHKKQ